MAAQKEQVTVGGRNLVLSNLDKAMYPAGRFSKAQVIDYYIRISKYLLPHLKNRPVTLKRFPNGVRGEFFYEKDAAAFTPDWVKTFPVPRKESRGADIRYILINDLPTLVYLANLANLEIHPFLHRVPKIHRPTSIVFDLDPGEGANVLSCARVAFLLRDVLRELQLESFTKVSGSKGLQLYVPLNSAVTYEATQPFAKAIADLLAQQQPKLVVSQMSKALRAKRIFIDWSQNSDFKTTAGVYSLRAKGNHPFVSLPVEWAELEAAMSKNDVDSLYFNPEQAIARAKLKGDLFKPVLSLVQKLPREVTAFLQKQAAQQKRLADKQLTPYVRKRDFTKTKEPNPSIAGRSRQGSRRRFVIQKHAASHLHYDFRLEMHNVLKSWAVPKGPPYKVSEPRLAMPTEDHPIDYLDFEGIIPKGQYGGGTVMVWDIGTYNLIEGNYYKGYLKFFLSGVKLKGEWTLQRLPERDRDKWQLLKSGANTRSLSAKRDDQSALTNRTMAEIRSAADAQWQSNRAPVR